MRLFLTERENAVAANDRRGAKDECANGRLIIDVALS
jgi:hypothetical protein